MASVGCHRHNFTSPITELSHLTLQRILQTRASACLHSPLSPFSSSFPMSMEEMFVLLSTIHVASQNPLLYKNLVTIFCIPICVYKLDLLTIMLCN